MLGTGRARWARAGQHAAGASPAPTDAGIARWPGWCGLGVWASAFRETLTEEVTLRMAAVPSPPRLKGGVEKEADQHASDQHSGNHSVTTATEKKKSPLTSQSHFWPEIDSEEIRGPLAFISPSVSPDPPLSVHPRSSLLSLRAPPFLLDSGPPELKAFAVTAPLHHPARAHSHRWSHGSADGRWSCPSGDPPSLGSGLLTHGW